MKDHFCNLQRSLQVTVLRTSLQFYVTQTLAKRKFVPMILQDMGKRILHIIPATMSEKTACHKYLAKN